MRKAAMVLLIAGMAWQPGSAGAQQVQVSPANRTIAVTTTDSAERRADTALLHVGYQVYAPDSSAAYAKAAQISTAVAAALEHLGVAKDAIASESQSTQPTQEFQNQQLTPDERAQRRFEAQQSWTVKTTPDAVAALLAAAVGAGANQSGAIEWSLADEASLTSEASTKALAHAQQLAGQMAKGLGAKVGNLLYASNQVEVVRLPTVMRAMSRGQAEKATPELSLSAPMVTRSATVAAIFAIE